MEPGPTERHELDTAAATTPAGGSDASGAVGGQVTADGTAGGAPTSSPSSVPAAGDGAAPRPRNRRGWMSDSPLDGGSGWPTSAYAIIRRPDNYHSANGSASSSPANHAAPVVPTPQPVAAEPVEEAPPTSKVKVPRQKSWLRGRGWSNRSSAPGPEPSTPQSTVNPQTAMHPAPAEADIASQPVDGADTVARPAGVADAGAWTSDSLTTATRESLAGAAITDTAAPATRADDADQAGDLDDQTADSVDTAEAIDTADTTALATSTADASPTIDNAVDTTEEAHDTAVDGDGTAPTGYEPAALDLEAAEETRDLREAMRTMRRPDDGTSAGARGTAVVTAGPPPEDAGPDDPTDPRETAPADEAGTPRGLAIAAAVVIFVALAVVVLFVIRAKGTGTDEETAPLAPTTAAVVEPETSSAVSFAPEESPAVPGTPAPGALAGDVLRSGSVRLAIGSNQVDESFDFDSGIKGAQNAFAGGQQPDLDALTQGLWAANGAHVAVWTKAGSPTAADCRALPESDWTSLVKVEPTLVGPKVCVQTSEGRAGSFVARPIDVGPDGGVQTVYLDFTVWKKAGD